MHIPVNRCGEETTLLDEEGLYIELLDADGPLPGYVKFGEADWTFNGSWDGSEERTTTLLVFKDNDNWAVWQARYEVGEGTVRFYPTYVELSVGALAGDDVVQATGVLSVGSLWDTLTTFVDANKPYEAMSYGSPTRTITNRLITSVVCTNTSTITLTLPSTDIISSERVIRIARAGSGAVNVAPNADQTLNGGTSAVAISAVGKEVTVRCYDPGTWLMFNN